ncbi:unnamed protein product [Tilletia laevis]|nr:hypothetical protein CF336_g2146 [Tilletia laevis]KAE8202950.1 hypothetical protein CF328_g1924 [Tilletia controversa]KAE8263257.1 hypothetical protein A4X03_0g1817 [Tilletia caries]CAD6891409.1 unnamed protein product [Tilletia caries]CAD6907759.1 unnamed protein product [Tilletia laevis]
MATAAAAAGTVTGPPMRRRWRLGYRIAVAGPFPRSVFVAPGRAAQSIPVARCDQRRAASSSSSSSPSTLMIKYSTSTSQAKGKAASSDGGSDQADAGQAADGDHGERRRSARTKSASSIKKEAEDGVAAQSSADASESPALGLHSGRPAASDGNAQPAASAGPPASNQRSDKATVADAGPSWAEITNPRALVSHLDSYVIGQTRAKKALSVAVFNHYVRLNANMKAKQEREDQLMEQKWEAEREKERGLSRRRMQAAIEEAERLRSTPAPKSRSSADESEKSDSISPDYSSKSNHSKGSERAKSPRKGRSTEVAVGPLEETRPGRGAENILTDFIGQSEGASSERERELGYFSPNQPKLLNATARNSRRGRPPSESRFAEGDDTKLGSPIAASISTSPISDDRVRRAIRAANARLDGKRPEPEQVSSAGSDAKNILPNESAVEQEHQPAPPIASKPPLALPPFEKANVLLLGPTGVGKTLLLRTLASALHVPFVHVDATPLTQAGYVGEDVDSIVQRLLVASGWDAERAGFGICCIDEVDKLAARRGTDGTGGGRDVGGEGVQQALLRLLEGSVVTITDKGGQGAAAASSYSSSGTGSAGGATSVAQQPNRGSLAVESDQVPPWWPGAARSVSGQGPRNHAQDEGKSWSTSTTPTGRRATNTGLPGFSSGARSSSAAQAQNGVYNVDTSSVLFVLCGAFVGLEKIVRARLIREGSWPIESDVRSDRPLTHEEREDLLKQVEDVDLQAYGLIPEFLGRVPVLATLSPLDENDLVRVLTEPKNSLVSQYESLFASSGVSLRLTQPALKAIAAQAAKKSTGARGLKRIMEDRLLEAMYLAPGSSIKYGLMDEQAARGRGEVQLFSRGGKMAWLAAAADEEQRGAQDRKGVSSSKAAGTSGNAAKDEPTTVHSLLRRKSRIRLVRPSRLGHFRLRF